MNIIKRFIINYSGYGFFKWKFRKPGLYCFNYHRIGESEKTQFDPNVFSCTREMFEKHLIFYKSNFEVITIDQLIKLTSTGKALSKCYLLITFDDGYIDNYEEAFPLLKKHHLPATFFVSTNYIENSIIPWWDEVAYMIKQCDMESIILPCSKNEIMIDKKNIDLCLRNILFEIKSNRHIPIESVLNTLREQTKVNVHELNYRLFMNWSMLLEMVNAGMNIGSHSQSHKVLSSLSLVKQMEEVKNSKKIIEQKLDIEVKSFAYPEGGVSSYNQNSVDLIKKSGYKLGFNFIAGINSDIVNSGYTLNRFSVSYNSRVSALKKLLVSFY